MRLRSLCWLTLSTCVAGCTALDDPFGWRIADRDAGVDAASEVDGDVDLADPTSLCGMASASSCPVGATCRTFDDATSPFDYPIVGGFASAASAPGTSLTVVHAPAPSCRGPSALRAATAGADQSAYAGYIFSPASAPKPLHVRTFVYVDPSSAAGGFSLLGLYQRTASDIHWVLVQAQDAAGALAFTSDLDLGPAVMPFAGGLRRGHWACVELTLDWTDTSMTAKVEVDGVQRVSASGLPGLPGSQEVDVALGVARSPPSFQNDERIEIFYDELVVSNAHVGCL